MVMMDCSTNGAAGPCIYSSEQLQLRSFVLLIVNLQAAAAGGLAACSTSSSKWPGRPGVHGTRRLPSPIAHGWPLTHGDPFTCGWLLVPSIDLLLVGLACCPPLHVILPCPPARGSRALYSTAPT
jgi:hypothetical protein